MAIEWYDLCGYVGVLLVVLAFLFLQVQWLNGNGWTYQLMNALGAIGLMLSLAFGNFNLPAFLMELAWALIAIYGMIFSQRLRRRQPRGETDA